MLSDVLTVACAHPLRSLSGDKLPLAYTHGPAAAAAAVGPVCAVVRLARAMRADGAFCRGSVEGGARAATAARRVAEAPVARVGPAVGSRPMTAVPAIGLSGALGGRTGHLFV